MSPLAQRRLARKPIRRQPPPASSCAVVHDSFSFFLPTLAGLKCVHFNTMASDDGAGRLWFLSTPRRTEQPTAASRRGATRLKTFSIQVLHYLPLEQRVTVFWRVLRPASKRKPFKYTPPSQAGKRDASNTAG